MKRQIMGLSKTICRNILVLVVIFGVISACKGQKHKTTIDKGLGISYLDSLRADKNIPGISAAITVDGSLVWEYGSGYSDMSQKKEASSHTLYRIASVSKLITTAAIAKMVQNNAISFSDDANQYFRISDNEISIARILSHTSGIRHYYYNEKIENYPHYDKVSDAVEIFIDDPLESAPGEKFRYSSFGINLIGAIIEKKSKQSFEDFVQENVLRPLKMNHTFMREPKSSKDLSVFYESDQSVVSEIDLSYNIPGGGMYSTVKDLVKLGDAFLQNSYLKEDIKNQLFTNAKLNNGEEVTYGLGWIVQKLKDGSKVYYHDGHMDGTHSILAIYPKFNTSISIISNKGSNFGVTEALELFCKVNTIDNCPEIIADNTNDPELIMKTFQNLSSGFQDFQSAIGTKDRPKIEGLISDTFKSGLWPNKNTFTDFLMEIGNEFEVFEQDFTVRGLENGENAFVKTIRFQNKYPNKSWFLKYVLNDSQWSIISIGEYN